MKNGHLNGNVDTVHMPPKINPQTIQEPVKMILQLLYAVLAVVPLFVFSVCGYFFSTTKSIKGKTVLVRIITYFHQFIAHTQLFEVVDFTLN
jgi:hypothetical protein